MTNRARKTATWIALETGGPGVDPSANGAGYLHVPTQGDGGNFLNDETEMLETDFEINRNENTAPMTGAQRWSAKLVTPLLGLAAAAGDGITPGADDWLDLILLHLFGIQIVRPGEGVGVGSTTSSLVADSDAYSVEDLLPIYEAGVPAAGTRTQWGHVETDAGSGTYGLAPALAAAPTTAGVIFGTKLYVPDDDHRGGPTISLVRREDEGLFLGSMGRINTAKMIIPASKQARLEIGLSGVGYGPTTKNNLPTPVPLTQTPIRGLLSPITFGGTNYSTDSIEIDLGNSTSLLEGTDTVDGAANNEQMMVRPKASIAPLYTNAINNLRREVTQGPTVIQAGGGVLVGGVLNTMAIYFSASHARTAGKQNKSGRIRAGVEIQANAGGLLGTAPRRYLMIARA